MVVGVFIKGPLDGIDPAAIQKYAAEAGLRLLRDRTKRLHETHQ